MINLADYMDEQGELKTNRLKCGAMKQMDNLLDKIFWYDRTVFEIISDGMPYCRVSKKNKHILLFFILYIQKS